MIKKYLLSLLLFLFVPVSLIAVQNKLQICMVELEKWGEKDPANHRIKGIYVELFEEFSRRTQINTELNLYPYPRVISLLGTSECDMTITLPSQKIMDRVAIGEQIWKIRIGLISKASLPIKNYNAIHGKTVGVIRGARITSRFDLDQNIKRVSTVRFYNLLKMLKNGRIDAIAGDLHIIGSMLENHEVDIELAPPLVLTELSLNLMMGKTSSYIGEFEKYNAVFGKMKNDGTVKRIVGKYLISEWR